MPEVDLERAAGFVTLVVRYLYDIGSQINRLEYAKSALSVLVRTDFASLFKAQHRAVRDAFSAESIEEAANLGAGTLQGLTLFGGGFRKTQASARFTAADWITSIKDPSSQKIKRFVDEAKEFDKLRAKIDDQPTLAQLNAKDLLSRGAVGYDSNSMGAFRLSEEKGDLNSDLPRLEFRELANAPVLSWPKWAEFAFECFDLYAAELKLEEKAEVLAVQAPAAMPVPPPVAPAPAAIPAGPPIPPRLARVLFLLLVLSQLLRQVEAD